MHHLRLHQREIFTQIECCLIQKTLYNANLFRFKGISLRDPTKKGFHLFRQAKVIPPRNPFANYYHAGTPFFHEAVVNLQTQEFERHLRVPRGFHGSCDDDENFTGGEDRSCRS